MKKNSSSHMDETTPRIR